MPLRIPGDNGQITLAVFDLAGTTIDEGGTVYRVLAETVKATGAPVTPADVAKTTGMDKREAIRLLLPDAREHEPVYQRFRENLETAYRQSPPRPFPGVEALFEQLHRAGIAVALTTGFDREVTEFVLNPLGWGADLVDAVICTTDVPQGRPAPYMIFRAMERTSTLSVRHVLAAGDTVADLQAGTNAGAALVVGVLTGADTREQLEQVPHSAIVRSLVEIG
ncbi:phosphonatase-like hydrolase [Amycolatopsis sp. GM8]|uniref:phosphonatase-like hydrolase n=1 Tax=Amycolatopsis sp. GM8 TaxID=2896530 RepID=UPI001F2DB5F0|nr:phosphonatase-like hydrolase [Amycolatopsis sp. GM8]